MVAIQHQCADFIRAGLCVGRDTLLRHCASKRAPWYGSHGELHLLTFLDFRNFVLRYGDFHLHLVDADNLANGLPLHDVLAYLHALLGHIAAERRKQPCVAQALLGNLLHSLRLLQLTLSLHPLLFGQRTLVVQLLVAVVGILGRAQRGLCRRVGVLCSRGIHHANQLTRPHSLSLHHVQLLQRAARRETQRRTAHLLDGARESLLAIHTRHTHLLCLYLNRSTFAPFLLPAASDEKNTYAHQGRQ